MMRAILIISVVLTLSCTSIGKGREKQANISEHPISALEVFRKYGCKNCHVYPGLKEYTDYGKEAALKGYGCISLLTRIKSHSASLEARRWFRENRCSECHDIGGKGTGRQNLTPFGLEMEKRDLGCVGVFKELRGEE